MAGDGETTKNEDKEEIKDQGKEQTTSEGSYKPSSSREYATMLGCIPLALSALIVGVLLILSGLLNIRAWVLTRDELVLMAGVLGVVQVLAGIWALAGTCFRSARLMDHSVWIASRLCFWSIFSSILDIVSICELGKADATFEEHKRVAVWGLVIQQLIFCVLRDVGFVILSWWIIGCFLSLNSVFEVGGNGWECKNYIQIKAEMDAIKINLKLVVKDIAAVLKRVEESKA